MSSLFKIAVVGRPNVGKSALFNRICKKKIAIVDEAEGVTRDRIYAKSEIFNFPFEVIDTGGINIRSTALFNEEVKRQAEIAIEEADSIIMVVDGHIGVTELDVEVARILQRAKKPLCLAVNKIDNHAQETLIYQFQRLGIPKIIAVSATQNWHIAELLEAATEKLPKTENSVEETPSVKIALIGRANVGKSSLINYLLDEERCIVSPIPGTTRDSIDIRFSHEGKDYTLIDTAGIRRKHAEHDVVDKFAAIRTKRSIERADICLLMLDAQEGMTTQEKRIANMIEEAGKGCILLFNKWDLVKGFRMEHCLKEVEDTVPFLRHCPKIFISALTGRNVDKIFAVIEQVYTASRERITTHQLNKFLIGAMQKNHPPMIMGKRLRVYYMAQVSIQPPKFILFVNYVNLMSDSYKKYLYNQFREAYQFTGVPIEIYLKGKERSKAERQEARDQSLYIEKNTPQKSKKAPPPFQEEEYYEEEFEEPVEMDFDDFSDPRNT